jgi:hypothetical protein
LELADFHFAIVDQGAYLAPATESKLLYADNGPEMCRVGSRIPYNIAAIRHGHVLKLKIQPLVIADL